MSRYILFSVRIVTLCILFLNLIAADMFWKYLSIWDRVVTILMTMSLTVFAVVSGKCMGHLLMRGFIVILGALTFTGFANRIYSDSRAGYIPAVIMSVVSLLCFIIMYIEIIIKKEKRKWLYMGS